MILAPERHCQDLPLLRPAPLEVATGLLAPREERRPARRHHQVQRVALVGCESLHGVEAEHEACELWVGDTRRLKATTTKSTMAPSAARNMKDGYAHARSSTLIIGAAGALAKESH